MNKKTMKCNKMVIGITFLILVSALCLPFVSFAQEQTGERAKWFAHDRYGMFIHWGIYSGTEGIWKGERLRYDNDYAEWIQYRNRISKEEYATVLDRFDWASIDPEKWVILAKESGMKYVTLTAKHHDGFALWDSKSSSYNIANYSNPKRDIVRELAEACKKHGLKLGLYYSHWQDWEHPYGWDNTNEIYPLSAENYDAYWQEKVVPQIRELLTEYGDIAIMWFDMWIHHSETIITKEQLFQIKRMIRELQPDCLINSRLGLSVEEDPDVDFRTLGDNQLGTEKLEYPWQTPATVAHSWGFNSYENQWKSTTSLLKALIGNVSLNGNIMLNIGPRANGDVPFEITSRLDQVSKWLQVNGESIYGAGAFDLRSDIHDWGHITYKRTESGKHKVYLQVFNWPLDKKLLVTGIKTKPSKVYALADKSRSPLNFDHEPVFTKIDLDDTATDPFVSVIVMEYDERPEVKKGLVAKNESGGYSFTMDNAQTARGGSEIVKPSLFGSIPRHTVVKQLQTYTWELFVDKPSTYLMDASYSFQGKSEGGRIVLKINGQELEHKITPTGKMVDEPLQNSSLNNYASQHIGEIQLNKKGTYTIEATIRPNKRQKVNFQWLWLQKK